MTQDRNVGAVPPSRLRPGLPIVYDLDCADIIRTLVQVYDVYNDPYDLDAVGIPSNGWTCDGLG
jgi:hypothetical protein